MHHDCHFSHFVTRFSQVLTLCIETPFLDRRGPKRH